MWITIDTFRILTTKKFGDADPRIFGAGQCDVVRANQPK